MKQVILDTSFILTCVKQKIDFSEQLKEENFQIIVPDQVFEELEGLTKSKIEAETAMKILQKIENESLDLESKNTDEAIIKFANENPKIIVATLDRKIRRKTKNKKMIIRGKKYLEII